MKRRTVMTALAAILAVALAGCGGNQRTSPDSGTGSEATQSGTGTSAASAADVPPGVAQQYATMSEEMSGQTTQGPWRIGYIVEDAEGWFVNTASGDARFREPAPGETNHIEILPFQKDGGRLVPGVPITVEVVDAEGNVVDRKELQLYYSGAFFHYASNFSIPEPGSYTLDVAIGVPSFPRHGDKQAGPDLADGAHVQFENVQLD